tara:strand:- start:122 stop:802 length:681 start_codon:yes stop_codon:yes gene_type:complete
MKLNLLEVIKFRKQGFTSQQIADKFGVSISIYEKFVTKNKTNIPKPIKFKGAEENIKKWKKANPNLNFDKLASSQKSLIKKSGNIYIGTGINPSLGHSKIDLDIEKIKRLREKNFTTEQIAKELGVSTSVIERRVNEEEMPKVSNQKISSERLKFLDEAAKKYGFKDFASVKGRNNRINIAKEATRREENIPEGQGRPGGELTKIHKDRIGKGVRLAKNKKKKFPS